MPLSWNDNLSVKNDVIDMDHRFLIELINEIEQIIKTKSHDDLFLAVDRLAEYAEHHFAREEKISRLVGYEHINHLHHAHSGLIDHLSQRKQTLVNMGNNWSTEVVNDFVKFLMDWLVIHVIKEDLQLKKTLQKYPADFNPDSVMQLRYARI